jgi:hypothetical protein
MLRRSRISYYVDSVAASPCSAGVFETQYGQYLGQ